MGYDEIEQSVASGRPIELHDFNVNGTHYCLTSTGEDITYFGKTFESAPCERSEIDLSGDPFKDKLEVTLPRGHALAAMYISGVPEFEVSYILYRGHYGVYRVYYQGIVDIVTFDEKGIPKAIISPSSSANSGAGKRRRCSRLCDHILYEYGCFVDQEAFKVEGTIDTIDGTTITASEFGTKAGGWFVGGKIIIGDAVRFIKSHVTTTITINRAGLNAEAGDAFTAHAGCDGHPDTCENTFEKKLNFGGEENLPRDNVFTSSVENGAQENSSGRLYRKVMR